MSAKNISSEILFAPIKRKRNWLGSLLFLWAVGLFHSSAIAQSDEGASNDGQTQSVEAAPSELLEADTQAARESRGESLDPRKSKPQSFGNSNSSLVSVRKNSYLPPNGTVEEMVTILGKAHAEGRVNRELVTILGNVRMEGSVGREMVTILGDAYVNGPVGREVVVVLGNLELGPKAEAQDITVVAGTIEKDPNAIVSGSFTEVPIYLPFVTDSWEEIHPYVYEGLALGRFVVPSMEWSWILALGALGGLVLLAAAFPKPAEACVDAMENKPAQSIVFGFAFQLIGLMIVSVVAMLLVATGIGILAIPFLGMALLFMWLLSFIAIYGVIGRRFGARANIAIATLIGGVLVTLTYAVPVLGFLVFLAISVLGSGAVIVSIYSALSSSGSRSGKLKAMAAARRQEQPLEASVSSEPAASWVSEAFGDTQMETEGTGAKESSEGTAAPAREAEALGAFEPVGFGPRFLALLIDFVVVVFSLVALEAFGGLHLMDNFLLPWLGYHLAFWTWRGTTLGGLALGLKLERTNGEELTFGVALVRSLASIISFVCLGFGFFWASWDADRQSWHDKIAGTVIVRVPKGVSLI